MGWGVSSPCIHAPSWLDCTVCIVTVLWAKQPRVQIPVGDRDVYFVQNFQSSNGPHPASYSEGTGFFPDIKALTFKKCGGQVWVELYFLSLLYVFMAWAGTIYLFTFTANGLRDYGRWSNRSVWCMFDLSGSRYGPVVGFLCTCGNVTIC